MTKPSAFQPVAFPSEPPLQVHLSDYLNILRRRKWIVILFFVFIVGIVTAVSFKMTPVYRATAQVIIEGQSAPLADLSGRPLTLKRDPGYFQTQYNLLRSRSLALAVIQKLKLTDYLLRQIKSDALKSAAAAAKPQPVYRQPTDTDFVNWYLAHLRITPIRGTKLVNISFTGSDRDLITRIANAHAKTAVQLALAKKRATAQQALDWIRKQLESQRAEVERSRRQIYEYKKANDIISLQGRQSILYQTLAEMNSTLSQARAKRMAKEAVYRQLKTLRNAKSLLTLPEISHDAVIQNLRRQLVDLKAKQLQMATSYGPKHPKMIEIKKGIRQLQQDILAEIGRLKKTIQGELARAIAYETAVQKSIDTQKKLVVSLDEKAIQYNVLQRKAKSSQKLYEFLLKQAETANLMRNENTSTMSIIDTAEIPEYPIKPRIFLNILLAVVLGLFMGTALAFFTEYMDNTVKTPEDIFRRLQLPVIGTLPYERALKTGQPKTLIWDKTDATRQSKDRPAYLTDKISRQIPATLPMVGSSDQGQILMLESATMGEGKTTVLASMATNFAGAGLRTLMIDCDFQRPSLHTAAKTENREGIANALEQISAIQLEGGTLKDLSIGDLFFIISLKRKSGFLSVSNGDQTMRASFANGRLIHLQNRKSPLSSRLGAMLIKGEFITGIQLKDALERQQRTGQPLGYILVNAGYVKRDKLRGPIKLQTEEHLQQLFSWKSGKFIFKPAEMRIYGSEKIGFDENYAPLIETLTQLEGSKLLEDALFSRIIPGPNDNLFLLTAGNAANGTRVSANVAIMTRFLNMLKRQFDVILVDAPPLDSAASAPALSTLVDGIVLVVKAGGLSFKALQQALGRISDEKIIGTVLNQVKAKNTYYYR